MPNIDLVALLKRTRRFKSVESIPSEGLPAALIDSLSALDVATAVVGNGDRLLFASDSARALGFVRQERLFGDELLALCSRM